MRTSLSTMTENWTLLGNNTSPCDHDDDGFKYRAYIITYLVLFPFAFISNAVILVVFLLQRHHRSSACSVVVLNLALSDTSFSLTLPLRLVYHFKGGVWDFPDWLCRLCVYGFYMNLYTSILFLTLLSILRWLAVVHPQRQHRLNTPTRALWVCVGVWLFVGVSSVPFLFSGVTHRTGYPRCFEPPDLLSLGRVLTLNYVALAVGFVLPFLTIILCYGSIVHRLISHTDNRSSIMSCRARQRNRRRSVHLVTMVMATFILCFLPYHVVRTLHLHALRGDWSCDAIAALHHAVVVTLCVAATNSVINPVLYYCSGNFREGVRAAQATLLTTRGNHRGSRPDLR